MTDLEWAININRFMLKIVGLWPPDNARDARDAVRSKLRMLYNFITVLCILTIPSLLSLIRVWGDMALMIDNLQYSLTMLMTTFKIGVIWYKQEALAPLIDMIERDWMKTKTKEERDVMLKCARITRAIAMCGVFMTLSTPTVSFGLPCLGVTTRHVTNLTDLGKPLPVPSYYLHDVSRSPLFELTFFAQGIVMFATALSYSAVDNFLGLLVIHVCGQLENLHSRLAHMENYSNFYAALKHNVQDHVRLIRSIKIIDDTFDLMLFGLILFFGILFCLQGFLVTNVVKQKAELSLTQVTWLAATILYILLHMCLYCAVGEILVTQSERIHRATYEYAWYAIESKAAKNLILIMLRSEKPLYITAGKIFPMTLVTLCNLLKTSAGYISVLIANQN